MNRSPFGRALSGNATPVVVAQSPADADASRYAGWLPWNGWIDTPADGPGDGWVPWSGWMDDIDALWRDVLSRVSDEAREYLAKPVETTSVDDQELDR